MFLTFFPLIIVVLIVQLNLIKNLMSKSLFGFIQLKIVLID